MTAQSTKRLKTTCGIIVSAAKIPPSTIDTPQLKQHDIFVTVYEPKSTVYTYQTGQFPSRSSRGNKYQRRHRKGTCATNARACAPQSTPTTPPTAPTARAFCPIVRSNAIHPSTRTHPVPAATATAQSTKKLKTTCRTSVSAAKIPLSTIDAP